MKLEWHYRLKGADLYDMDNGVRVGCVHEGPNGDCIAMHLQENGAWKYLADKLPFIKAKHVVEVVARLS